MEGALEHTKQNLLGWSRTVNAMMHLLFRGRRLGTYDCIVANETEQHGCSSKYKSAVKIPLMAFPAI